VQAIRKPTREHD